MGRSLPPDFYAKSAAFFEQKVAEETAAISHAQFVAGLKDGTMKVTAFKGNPYWLIQGTFRRKAFALHVLFYLCAPLIFVPLWSWQQGNPWLLFGILASWTATFITRKLGVERRQYPFGGLLLLLAVFAWIFLGRHSNYTVFLTCAVFGSVFYLFTCETQQQFPPFLSS